MRITFATVNRNVQRNLSRRYSDMVGLQEQLATGKRLRKASDNPIDVANTIKLRAKEAQLSQYKRNIQDGLAVMGVGASAMASMNDILHRARELAVQAANGTYNDSDRLYMQQEVDQLFRQMMSVVNTQFKGSYIFNGTNGNVPPYKIVSSGAELTDYTNRTMATFGSVFARKADGNEWNTANIPDPGLVTGVSHAGMVPPDTLYLNYTSSHLRVGDKVQLTWNSVDPTVNGRSLQYVYPETMPLDRITINGRDFTNGVVKSSFPSGTILAGSSNQLFRENALSNPARNITPGTVSITANNGSGTFTLIEGKDYTVNYSSGSFTLLNSAYNACEFDVQYRIDGEKGDYAVDYVTGEVSILSEDFRDALNGIDGGSNSRIVNVPAGDHTTPTQLNVPIVAGSVTVTYRDGTVVPPADYTIDPNGVFTMNNNLHDAEALVINYERVPTTAANNRKEITAIGSSVYRPDPPLTNAPVGLMYRTDNVFQIVEGKFGDDIRDIFPGSMTIKIGNKEYKEGHGEYQPDYYDENGVLQPGKNKYDYSVDYETGKITVYNPDLMRDMRPEWLGGPAVSGKYVDTITGVSTGGTDSKPLINYPGIEVNFADVDLSSVTVTVGGVRLNSADYEIIDVGGIAHFRILTTDPQYDKINTEFKVEFKLLNSPDVPTNMYRANQLQMTFDYITRGVDIYGDMVTSKGDILRNIEEGIVVPINIGADDLLTDSLSGKDMVGTLLRYSQALLKDDRDGIQSALDELTNMYDAVLNSQSKMGAQIYRFELTEQRNGEQSIEVGAQVSALADADLAEVISKLMLAESVYNAALQAAMRVLQPSLANYM